MEIYYKSFNVYRSYGVEMEFGNEVPLRSIENCIESNSHIPLKTKYYKQSINNNNWDLKLDGSCGKKIDRYGMNEGGFELSSFKARGVKQMLHIANVAKNLKRLGVKVNKNCGFHVHVDVSDFDEFKMGMLIANWVAIEDIVLQAVPSNRRYNKFCYPLKSYGMPNAGMYLSPEELWHFYKPKTTSMTANERRRCLNLVNYYRFKKLKNFKRSTVEFRFPEGTLVEDNIKNWIRLLVNFVSNTPDTCDLTKEKNLCDKSLKDILFILGLGSDKNNFTILSKGLLETKIWFLKRLFGYSYMSDIADEAQDILEEIEGIKKCL